jgi:hypothetical protein
LAFADAHFGNGHSAFLAQDVDFGRLIGNDGKTKHLAMKVFMAALKQCRRGRVGVYDIAIVIDYHNAISCMLDDAEKQ